MRLMPSTAILHELLDPASKSLRERSVLDGETAGKVFYEYATFCASQLEDQYAMEDTKRMESLHRNKQQESVQYLVAIQEADRRKDKNTVKNLTKERDRALKMQKM